MTAPPRQKVFHLFVGDHDFDSPASYSAVTGELRAVGRHCQVYVDREHADHAGLMPAVEDAVATFDRDVYPKACRLLGNALDTDRDGRFTLLFTGVLGRLQRGKVSVDGFVRGSDFQSDISAPFGNACDMMYLNTTLKPGPHLRSLLAHEYTHAVVFSEHVFGDYLPVAARRDEESWLNEGLAHLCEELHGHGWSNLDYRVSAFLNAPQRHRLVVPDYYGSGLWRDPGTRGSAYLFLRWCHERHGPDLPRRLAQSSLNGVLNIEAATRTRFADLFRGWSASVLFAGASLTEDASGGLDLHRTLGGRLLCGPFFEQVPLGQGRHEVMLPGTGVAYLLLHSPAGSRSRLRVEAEQGAALQATLVRLPRHTARLDLRCECQPGDAAVRLVLTAHNADVRLDHVAWERLVPRGKPSDTNHRAEAKPGEAARSWFGDVQIRASESRTSGLLRLPGAGGVEDVFVFKVAATDSHGHRVAGWALVDLSSDRP